MAIDTNEFDATYQAYGDLRSNQFYSVEFQAANVVQRCSAVTATVMGLLQNNPNSGEMAVVRHLGVSKYVANGTVVNGQLLGGAANGALDAKTAGTDTTNYVIAQDVAGASSGDIGVCLLRGVPVRAA